MRQQRGAIFDCFPFFIFFLRRLFKNASHGERQREVGVGDCHDRERGSRMPSCTLDLRKLRLGWGSVHFIHVEHANDMGDLFNAGIQESIRWSKCVQVCVYSIDFTKSVTVVCRLWLLICMLWCYLLSTCTCSMIWRTSNSPVHV